jgi:predicted CXXCH cytochrome family protein
MKPARSWKLPASHLILVVGIFASLLGVSLAQDPPHWSRLNYLMDCTSTCHVPHQAPGSALTASAGNVNLCQACHNPGGDASDRAVNDADKAIRNSTGTSHAFDVPAVNAQLDTLIPLNSEMSLRVMGGNVVCSTCHNQHKGEALFGGTSRVRPTEKITALGSTGDVTSGGTFTGVEGVWYLIEISQAGNQASARFRYSKDNGVSWFPEQDVGVGVALDSGVNVTFGNGSYALGDRWEFGGAWPFLRAILDSGNNATGDAYCRDCHRSWVMTHTDVELYDGNYKSHPIGVGLNANGQGYDRTIPLDGNGADQGSGSADSNPTNDFRFDANGNVQCLTCHGVHYVDSNTQTVDVQ